MSGKHLKKVENLQVRSFQAAPGKEGFLGSISLDFCKGTREKQNPLHLCPHLHLLDLHWHIHFGQDSAKFVHY